MDSSELVMVETRDVHKYFKDLHVLKGISTTVYKGQVVAIIGPSAPVKALFYVASTALKSRALARFLSKVLRSPIPTST